MQMNTPHRNSGSDSRKIPEHKQSRRQTAPQSGQNRESHTNRVDNRHVSKTDGANKLSDTGTAVPKLVRYKGTCDKAFLALVLVLISFGSVMVFSASYAYSMNRSGDSYAFIKKQIFFVALGLVFMFCASLMDPEHIRRLTPFLFIGTIGLLLLVLIIGTVGGGAKRWLSVGNLFTVQPSEIAKLALVLQLAMYMEKYKDIINDDPSIKKRRIYGIGYPLIYIGIICLLVVLEKHLSATVILFVVGIIVIWAGGADRKFMVASGTIGVTTLALVAWFVPYTRRRIDIWFNPEKNITGDGWQTIQGLRAIGSGGLLGLGPTNSRQKHMYVSQPQNDFIYSILCEELGFVGAVAVIVLFIMLIVRGYMIAMKAPDMFTSLAVTGIVSKVGLQAAFNIGVVTNTLPNTGISLPFFSYGGSSTLILLVEMGIVLAISRYSSQEH